MDIQYLLYLQKFRELSGGVFDSFVLALTKLGEPLITFGLLAAIYWCVDKKAGRLMALNVSIACTWNQGLKNICKIERPWVLDERIQPVEQALAHAGGYSFPSGHTSRATAVFGAWAKRLHSQNTRILSVICASACIVTAFTRNYLGVHTAKDVLASLAMGIFLINILEYAHKWVEKGKYRDLLITFIACLTFLALMLKVGCLSNAGTGVGFLLGWIIERRFIRFEIEGSVKEKLLRFGIGSFVLIFFYTIPKAILLMFMEGKYAGFFSNFLFAIILMAGYPYLFSKVKSGNWKRTFLMIGALALLLGVTFTGAIHERLDSEGTEESETVKTEVAEPIDTVEQNPVDIKILNVQSEDEVQVIAHRGYSSQFPENTLAAIEGACEIGAGYIELDVQITNDGVPVIFHDTDLKRITGMDGIVCDYTYEELCNLDVGSWFGADYSQERIPTLDEALECMKDTPCRLYLELKDIGIVEDFEQKVVATVQEYDMSERCVYASFNYDYLVNIKGIDENAVILYNTSLDKLENIQSHPAEYYGVNLQAISSELVQTIHGQGGQVFVWTVDTPEAMKNCINMGVDGLVTNKPGLARVVVHPEYEYLVDNFEKSFTMPGLYEENLPEVCKNVVVQGFTKTPQHMIVSAYSKTGENSILFVMNLEGKLLNVVDLQFVAHTGGISYDSEHDYLWVTGPSGSVYAISYTDVINGTYIGEIKVSFDAGLLNHAQAKVASFLTWFQGELYVGSYVDGVNGQLNRYDLSDVSTPTLIASLTIPERIQGITFREDTETNTVSMYLSQGYQTLDAGLLRFEYSEECLIYEEPVEYHVLPEGIEQIQASTNGMYLLFESAALPYRATARIPNDQIWLVRE